MKISLMIHTASSDNFLTNQGIPSYFQALIDNLNRQTFKDFELVYIDTYFETNQKNFSSINSSFQIKHVPIHVNHRYWYDLGYCYISAAKNTGILYADGELLVTCDDAEFFPDNFLEKYWCYKECEYYMHSLHKRMKSINIVDGKIQYPIDGDIYINDHRFNAAKESKGVKYHNFGSWTFAGTSFSLKDALTLNGFNEKMDGCKSLEDCDFGGRLALLGNKFAMDVDGFLYILDHKSYGATTFGQDGQVTVAEEIINKKIDNFIAIENYGMLRCAEELFDVEANKNPINDKQLAIIKRETIKYRNFDPLAPENKDKLDIWLKTPNFSLKQERAELRKSKDWKW